MGERAEFRVFGSFDAHGSDTHGGHDQQTQDAERPAQHQQSVARAPEAVDRLVDPAIAGRCRVAARGQRGGQQEDGRAQQRDVKRLADLGHVEPVPFARGHRGVERRKGKDRHENDRHIQVQADEEYIERQYARLPVANVPVAQHGAGEQAPGQPNVRRHIAQGQVVDLQRGVRFSQRRRPPRPQTRRRRLPTVDRRSVPFSRTRPGSECPADESAARCASKYRPAGAEQYQRQLFQRHDRRRRCRQPQDAEVLRRETARHDQGQCKKRVDCQGFVLVTGHQQRAMAGARPAQRQLADAEHDQRPGRVAVERAEERRQDGPAQDHQAHERHGRRNRRQAGGASHQSGQHRQTALRVQLGNRADDQKIGHLHRDHDQQHQPPGCSIQRQLIVRAVGAGDPEVGLSRSEHPGLNQHQRQASAEQDRQSQARAARLGGEFLQTPPGDHRQGGQSQRQHQGHRGQIEQQSR